MRFGFCHVWSHPRRVPVRSRRAENSQVTSPLLTGVQFRSRSDLRPCRIRRRRRRQIRPMLADVARAIRVTGRDPTWRSGGTGPQLGTQVHLIRTSGRNSPIDHGQEKTKVVMTARCSSSGTAMSYRACHSGAHMAEVACAIPAAAKSHPPHGAADARARLPHRSRMPPPSSSWSPRWRGGRCGTTNRH
jgi:hypothetical protein